VDRWIGQLKQPLLLYGQKFLIIGQQAVQFHNLSALVYCGLALPNLPETLRKRLEGMKGDI